MSNRSGEAAERPICVTGQNVRSSDGVLAEITLKGETLENIASAPYLGVCFSETLKWEDHINKITSKANSTLDFFGGT